MDLREVGVRERLLHGDAARRVELQHRLHQLDRRRARVREERAEGAALHTRGSRPLRSEATTQPALGGDRHAITAGMLRLPMPCSRRMPPAYLRLALQWNPI